MNLRNSNSLLFKSNFSLLLILVFSTVRAADSDCNRTCLEGYVDKYLDAVIDNAPQRLPLAQNARFTEDAQRLAIGDGLWRTMKGKGSYRLFVTDVKAGQVTFIGTIQEDHREANQFTPALIALRLKVRNQEITEVEQFVVRSEDAAKRVEALGKPHHTFLETIPKAERMSRKGLIETANKYFTGMQKNDGKGDYPFTDDCNRIENGMHSTNAPTPAGQTRPDPATADVYSGQWGCKEQFQSGLIHFVNRIRDRRFVAVDRGRGLLFTFVFFDHSGGETRTFVTPAGRQVTAGPVQPWTWQIAELFKVENGQIRQIEAILARSPYGMLSGWSSWEDGMSDKIQDVTMN
ncbi:MAG: hypothetical protein A3G96_07055 [Gammaproteobacteria bacterium RIFCSPLOWO2_12_FULL_52_10]|nr:MAG: hypothetical protein A3G96_07055 [Gammaproteobacteria bacterium RIFCSPLOWO2_12_FULL_52_10]